MPLPPAPRASRGVAAAALVALALLAAPALSAPEAQEDSCDADAGCAPARGASQLQKRFSSGAASGGLKAEEPEKGEPHFPAQMITCHQTVTPRTGKADWVYKMVVRSVWSAYDGLGSAADKQDFAACLVRFAGHDFMDFRWKPDGTSIGGSDGCIHFGEGDNNGLAGCLTKFKVEDIFRKNCQHKVSLADFFVIAAEAAMARTATRYTAPGFAWTSLESNFMSAFRFGRKTATTCEDGAMMPDAEEGCYDLKRIFVDHVFLDTHKPTSWERTTAISGVHTLGGAKPANSGYNGTWTTDPGVFNNAYFLRILDQGWAPQRSAGGKNQWKVVNEVEQKFDKSVVKGQMMLNSDLCLTYDNALDSVDCDTQLLNTINQVPAGKPQNQRYRFCKAIRGRGHFLNSKERTCCVWTRPDKMFPDTHRQGGSKILPLPALYSRGGQNHHCGRNFSDPAGNWRNFCCRGMFQDKGRGHGDRIDCDYRGNIEGPGFASVMKFAYSESDWLNSFQKAWTIATENSLKFTQNQAESKRHFKNHQTANCGCCRPKKLIPGDEGYEECETMKSEDTYDPEFWKQPRTTWPLFGDGVRDSVTFKFSRGEPLTGPGAETLGQQQMDDWTAAGGDWLNGLS